MIAGDLDGEMQLLAEAVRADEARAWSRPSLSQRIRAWFIDAYVDDLARKRRACEKEAQALGAIRIDWKDERGGEVIWSEHA